MAAAVKRFQPEGGPGAGIAFELWLFFFFPKCFLQICGKKISKLTNKSIGPISATVLRKNKEASKSRLPMAVGWNMLQFQFTIAVCLFESEVLGNIFY